MSLRASTCLATIGALGAMFLGTAAFAQGSSPVMSCQSLVTLALPDTTITWAEPVHDVKLTRGTFQPPSTYSGAVQAAAGIGPDDITTTPPFCLVHALVKTSPRSTVGVSIWLPLTGWNGNFMGLGNGPLANGNKALQGVDSQGATIQIGSAGLGDAVRRGFAGGAVESGGAAGPASSTTKPQPPRNNIGPAPADSASVTRFTGKWPSRMSNDSLVPTITNPDLLIDYAYRAEHVMTNTGKAIARLFYGTPIKHSIFIGCSQGSEQAINEAGRYPKDYDGVIIGALMNPIATFNLAQLWPAWLVAQNPGKHMTTEDFALVHAAALKACGTPVGLKQGFIEDPERCNFDPAVLQCKNGQTSGCLTATQVEGLRQFYEGPVDPRTHQLLLPGPRPGAEGGYRGMTTDFPISNSALDLIRNGVHRNPKWDWRTMDYDTDIELARKTIDPLTYVAPAQLAPFVAAGNKIMFYEGWLDYHNAEATVSYYKAVIKADPQARNSMQVFAVPGMEHCNEGPGCDTFDKIGIMLQWLNSGQMPTEFTSYKISDDGKVIRSRPVCAWPKVSQYNGTGDMNDASSFSCVSKPIPASEKKLFERLKWYPVGFSK